MSKLVITIITILFSNFAVAGGIAGFGEGNYQAVSCVGDDVAVNHFFIEGTESLDLINVMNSGDVLTRIFDVNIINSLLNKNLIRVRQWDKTNWFKGMGLDIKKDVANYMTLLKKRDGVFHIGGGSTEYEAALPLVEGDIQKLPKTLQGQALKQNLKMEINANPYGEVTLDVFVVTSGVHKCVKTELVKNIWFEFNPEQLEPMIEVCVQHETVSDASAQFIESHTMSVNSCTKTESFPHKL